MYGESSGYFFRTRVVSDAESMVFLMVGISEKAARGKAADHFMGSLETFEPRSVFEGEWKGRRFERSGFKADFPGRPSVQPFEPYFEDGYSRPGHSYMHFVNDSYFGNSVQIHVVDLPPGSYMSDDSVYFSRLVDEFDEGFAVRPSQLVLRNGITGRETHFEQGGDSLHFRLIYRGLRTYFLSFTSSKDQLNSRAASFFDSFELLPLPSPTPPTSSISPALQKHFSSPPALPYIAPLAVYLPGVESTSLWMSQDSVSGTGYVLKEFVFSPYFRVDDLDGILAAVDEAHLKEPIALEGAPETDFMLMSVMYCLWRPMALCCAGR